MENDKRQIERERIEREQLAGNKKILREFHGKREKWDLTPVLNPLSRGLALEVCNFETELERERLQMEKAERERERIRVEAEKVYQAWGGDESEFDERLLFLALTDAKGFSESQEHAAAGAAAPAAHRPAHQELWELKMLERCTHVRPDRSQESTGERAHADPPSAKGAERERESESEAAQTSPLVVPAKGAHSATVIWLHGLGDKANRWATIAHELDLSHVKWVFPQANCRAVTMHGGASMPAWADIKGLSLDVPEDEEGTMATRDLIHKLIASEVKLGIPARRIVVGGFSQGAAMASIAALTHQHPLAGCFVLSGYLALRFKMALLVTSGGRATPFFQAHGQLDRVVPYLFGQLSAQLIGLFGVTVDFKSYAMGHESCPQELADLRAFICHVVPPPASEPSPSSTPLHVDSPSASDEMLDKLLEQIAKLKSQCGFLDVQNDVYHQQMKEPGPPQRSIPPTPLRARATGGQAASSSSCGSSLGTASDALASVSDAQGGAGKKQKNLKTEGIHEKLTKVSANYYKAFQRATRKTYFFKDKDKDKDKDKAPE